MKHLKKFAGLFVALVMTILMAVPTFAAEGDANITISNPVEDHIYKVYQILKGDVATETVGEAPNQTTKEVLSNIQWGSNAGEGLTKKDGADVDATQYAEGLAESTDSAQSIATTIAGAIGGDPVATLPDNTVEEGSKFTTSQPTGYYLIVECDKNGKALENQNYILQVCGDTTVNPKNDKPSFEKKVIDTNDSEANSTTGWQDSADHDINDEVWYKLQFKLPNNLSAYDSYKLVFNDTMSKGLTFVSDSAYVFVSDNELNGSYTKGEDGSVKVGTITGVSANPSSADYAGSDNTYTGGKVLTWTFKDVKKGVPSETEGNPKGSNSQFVTIIYKAKLNEDAKIGAAGNPNEATVTYTNKLDASGDGETTPKDKVTVFTFKLNINKVHNVNDTLEPLTGAGFTLYKKNTTGQYVAVKTKDGKIDPEGTVEEIKGTDLTNFTWTGLDDGEYKLAETTTPDGYNTINDILFKVEASHDVTADDPKLTVLTVKVWDADANTYQVSESLSATLTQITNDDGSIKNESGDIFGDIINKKGSELPETGGMGTTVLYVTGGLLVAAAAIFFVVNKRMKAE